jgi:hypothetical protein
MTLCELYLLGVEIRWHKVGAEWAYGYTFFCGSGNADLHRGTGFLHIRELSADNRVVLVIGCRVLQRGSWNGMIVLNLHALTKDRSDDVKDFFYEELE